MFNENPSSDPSADGSATGPPCDRCTTRWTGQPRLWVRETRGQRCCGSWWISAWTRNSRSRSAGDQTFWCSTTTPTFRCWVPRSTHGHSVGRRARWGRISGQRARNICARSCETGRAYHSEDQRLIINRHGYPEEAYFTFSLSAIRDADGTIVGLFNAITETTQHILYERRLQVLRRLGAISITADDSLASTCRAAVEVIGRNRKSVPFAAVYLRDPADQGPRRTAGYGFDETAAAPANWSRLHRRADR